MIDILFLFILATFARYIDENRLVWLAVGYFFVNIFLAFIFDEKVNAGLLIGLAILSFIIYFWTKLLHRAQSNIFTYFIILLGGTVGLYLISVKFT
ncbi:MAG: hypothetical protein A3C49_01985 [Candidatus Doudnabacteria bacterium RIFCSPHIGHO2_02_FULL_42_25]|uniref:Uncharacterized protein n=1 Tax=Candidatus Doudnabacteria bacterium RIFCSPHIGHO2_01_FULL_41_86 TaxID=1817821 RepID=A0A1F5N9V1_9BACT|nr:MAG: hypothetical protein A2717_01580 [Candidatus Doudnabacteria bacterium RIFCSPHIGHO2_01_FULL_41_86]OGE75034.1 MAG: hypothetical protein A3K07_04670 [Candidatus Doudnabacteria bacterium RIFCSPHIGHO2_01_43_10]OGE85259.1 MAG: hypothetical protein A3E28_01150 [Candidatus Doudnabacteria bacterium RIFCSPHIGHO2_12_FULL_42_22]OGE86797.1 MAG: hypothetical protein A3C49_01985 [Candidatus Doudnabacteria bacterium RIFCSPHIGHO2_02_FULL_42_25]OGE92396.1 MAG: hypothetical protein A2895_02140 [Candidatus